MKKSLLTICLLTIISSYTNGQNCKYEKNEVDQFTGKMTKLTKKKKLIETFNSEGFVTLQKVDTVNTLLLSYRTSFSKNAIAEEGAELSFILDNNEIITLKKNNGNYPITFGQLLKLNKFKTNTIRYYFTENGGSYKSEDIKIKNGNAEDFTNVIKCVL